MQFCRNLSSWEQPLPLPLEPFAVLRAKHLSCKWLWRWERGAAFHRRSGSCKTSRFALPLGMPLNSASCMKWVDTPGLNFGLFIDTVPVAPLAPSAYSSNNPFTCLGIYLIIKPIITTFSSPVERWDTLPVKLNSNTFAWALLAPKLNIEPRFFHSLTSVLTVWS